ncbi:MAG: ribosome biogenesis GTPase YlqF [Bacteriovoracaceae bacterium]
MKRENDESAPTEALFNWFPGHMVKAIREIKQRLKMVDVVLEIRDARVPLASGNAALDEALGGKNKILIFNKANLCDPEMVKTWSKWFEQKGISHLFVNCFDKTALKKVITIARKMADDNRRQSNPDMEAKTKLKMMIIGLPNTGKSTIINQLANRNAVKVADRPGLTQIQQWITIDGDVELLDTPGVMPPLVVDEEHALWLSAIHAIPDHIAGEEATACFVVKHLLEIKSKEFMERFKLTETDISVEEAYQKIATLRGCIRQKGLPDMDRVSKLVLAEFRTGELGRTCFELPPV